MPKYEFKPESVMKLVDLRALKLASMRAQIGVNPTSVENWLKGYSLPSLKSLLNLMNWYGVGPEFFFRKVEENDKILDAQ